MFEDVASAIGAVSAIAVGGAAVAAAIAAWEGLRTWREETVGRRRAELAEEVLADFYRARDIISWVRHPYAYRIETDDSSLDEAEINEAAPQLDTLHVPLRRLREENEFFAGIRAKRYRFQSVFGHVTSQHFSALAGIIVRIEIAADSEIRNLRGKRFPYMSEEDSEKLTQENEAVIWSQRDGDLITEQIDAIVSAVEAICRPAIEARARIAAR